MMQRKAPLSLSLFLAATILITGCQSSKENQASTTNLAADTTWAILPFIKVDSVNPVLQAGDRVFICPILKTKVKWEEKDVFNPAAVVKDGKVYLLYRAEDKIGKYAGTSGRSALAS